jgi:polygalacturonase
LAAAQPDVDAIASGITGPRFPDREFDITKYGAVGDGVTSCTQAIHKAMAACSAAGGGRVVVPAGRFLTGALHLESNVNLYVSKGATLSFSRDRKDYLPLVFTRFEGTECMNYSPFIYAFEKTNVGVSGPGTLDGQASEEYWWPMANKTKSAADRQAIVAMGDSNVPVEKRNFGEGHLLRPNFVQPYRCTNVLLEDFSIINSPMWELNPVLCKNVVVRNVSIDSHGPNNDGCDPESCDGVLIEGCTFSTGDDCIAVKSGRNTDGRRVNVPCQNVVIRNCKMKDGHGGVSIGSEVSGGIRGIYTDNCQMSSPHLQRALRIKTNSYRGGTIENIVFRNVTVGQVAEAVIEVDFFYEEGEGGPLPPVVRGINVANVTCQKSKYAIFLRGFSNDPISGVSIANCTFNNAAEGVLFQNVKAVDIKDVLVNGKPVSKTS